MNLRAVVSLFIAGLAGCLCVPGAWSDTGPKTLGAKRIVTAPVIDGEVSEDPAWRGFEPATGFTQVRPFAGQPATQRTEVFVGFTDEALYIGVICYDEEPDKIIVTDARRDDWLNDKDSFSVVLDMFHDKQNGFVFGTSPSSAEFDGQGLIGVDNMV